MSKLRQQLDLSHVDDTLELPPESDTGGWVCFTQLKKDGPFIYAGWINSPDERMGIFLAREHYGQDQKCTSIWIAPREYIGGLRENVEGAQEEVAAARDYQIFTQSNAGDQHMSSIVVNAKSAAEAIELAKQQVDDAKDMHNLWAIPVEELIATDNNDVIWRFTDQTYRLARGYSKSVRQKWQVIRAEQDLVEYEKEDIEESF